jgi:hypothetical protein
MTNPGEPIYELMHSGETAPLCCVCNGAADHKCAACGELICSEDSSRCEVCQKQHCAAHLFEADDLKVCFPDLAVLARETGVEEESAEQILAEVMA